MKRSWIIIKTKEPIDTIHATIERTITINGKAIELSRVWIAHDDLVADLEQQFEDIYGEKP